MLVIQWLAQPGCIRDGQPLAGTAGRQISVAPAPAGKAVRACGGFNQLWGAVLAEVNDKMAQFGGRLSLDDLDAEAGEWRGSRSCEFRLPPGHWQTFERSSGTGN